MTLKPSIESPNVKTLSTITVLCSYCKKFIGRKDGQGVHGTSHGICTSCLSTIKPSLAAGSARRRLFNGIQRSFTKF